MTLDSEVNITSSVSTVSTIHRLNEQYAYATQAITLVGKVVVCVCGGVGGGASEMRPFPIQGTYNLYSSYSNMENNELVNAKTYVNSDTQHLHMVRWPAIKICLIFVMIYSAHEVHQMRQDSRQRSPRHLSGNPSHNLNTSTVIIKCKPFSFSLSLFIPFLIFLFHTLFTPLTSTYPYHCCVHFQSGWFSPNTEVKLQVFDQKDYSVSATNTALHTGLNHKP